MRSSCGRARRWRYRQVNLINSGMSPEDLLETMQRREKGDEEYTDADLERMMEKSTEEKKEMHVEATKTKERRTVMNTKVPIHGT